MLNRVLFTIVFILCYPLLLVSIFLLPITGLIALFIWIIKGDEEDVLLDFALSPVEFFINLPYKIMNKE